MLKTRVIPTLLMKDVGLVKGVGFDSWRRVGTVLPAVKVYNRRQVDELILLDIAATADNRAPDIEEVRLIATDCFVPLTIGGGITDIETIKNLLRAGADKVALNTICYKNQDLVKQVAERFGTQCIVVGIDARKKADGTYSCYSHCGQQDENISPDVWAQKMESMGAGEILIASVERDGTMEGYDFDLIKMVTSSVRIPVIASGGAKDYEDFRKAIQESGAQAVSAASMFHFTQQTPLEAKDYLSKHGIAVRKV